MSKVKWLLETEVFGDDAQPLVDKLKELDIEYKVWPFGHLYTDFKGDCFRDDDCVVFYGCIQFGNIVKKLAKWVPGVYCNLPKFDCLYYYPRFDSHLLNWDYTMMPLGALKSPNKSRQLDHYTFGDEIFIRPSGGNKSFTGQLLNRYKWDKDLRMIELHADPETLIVVSKPARISCEWRTVVVEGNAEARVVAASQYKKDDKMTRSKKVPTEVIQYAQSVLDSINYKPDFVWTLDICESEGELHVLEVGSFSCAGLYECDPEAIITNVNRVALEEWESYQ